MSAPNVSSPSPSEGEQVMLRRLAVFAGGFTLEAAQAVADGSVEAPGSALWGQAPDHLPPGRPSATLVEALHACVHRGVLHREDGPTGAPRYRLPETVRTEGLAQLAANGEREAARRAHAVYFLAFVEAIDRRVWTAEYPHWMARLEADWANLQAALAWAEEAGEVDVSLRLGAALWLFWQTRGRVGEGRDWLERALARGGGQPRARAAALTVAGLLAWVQGDLDPAEAMVAEALAGWRALGFPQGIARALFVLALVAWRRGDEARTVAYLDEALGLFRDTDDLAGQPLCLIVRAILARGSGEHERALSLVAEATGLAEFGGFAWGVAAARYYEGEVRLDRGEDAGAAAAYRASIAISWDLGDLWTTGSGIGGMATVAALRGQGQVAARLFGAADALCARVEAVLPVLDRRQYDRVVAAARATLGEASFAAAYADGSALGPAAAVVEAAALGRPGEPDRVAGVPGDGTGAETDTPPRLTRRERDVLRLLVEGHEDAQIAQALGLSPRTVSERVGDLLAKFGLPNRTALAVSAVRRGLV